MKPNAVTISATYADRYTLDQLSQMIAARAKFLKQTPKKAVTATAINVLTSLKVDIRVAGKRPYIIAERWDVRVDSTEYIAGFAHPPWRGRFGHRTVRTYQGGPHHDAIGMNGKRLVNIAGAYRSGENPQVFHIVCTAKNTGVKFYECYAVAQNYGDAYKFAMNRVAKRIGQYRGVTRRLVGIMQHKVSGSGGIGADNMVREVYNSVAKSASELAADAAVVKKTGNDYKFSLFACADIQFSALALKHGPGYVATAMQKAANKTAGLIRKCGKLPMFTRPPETPFPELTSKAS